MSETTAQEQSDFIEALKREIWSEAATEFNKHCSQGAFAMYMTTSQAATFIAARTPNAAKKMLEELGVRPISMGPGKGRGYRWVKDEIVIAMNERRFGKGQQTTQRRPIALDIGEMLAGVYGN